MRTAGACGLAMLAGCGGPKESASTPAASAAPFVVTAVDVPLATSDSVVVYWTRVDSPEQVFSRLPGCARGDAVSVVPAPYGGGGLSGQALFEFAQKAAGSEGFGELLLKQLLVGVDPLAPGSAITVGDGDNEYFDAYVARTAENELVVFLAIVNKP
jgi:hypothetical protein